jgi:hypothetical protein
MILRYCGKTCTQNKGIWIERLNSSENETVFLRGAECDIVCAATCNSLSVFDGLTDFFKEISSNHYAIFSVLVPHFLTRLCQHSPLLPSTITQTKLGFGAPSARSPSYTTYLTMLCLRSEDAFVINCVANLIEVKVLYVQQDLWYEISSYWRFNV